MTAPTQQLPSWLSVSTSLATNAAGQPTATFTTLIVIPLTYYGPPIPLGTDGAWVYGGLSSPAPSPSSPTNSALTPASSTPATPFSTPAVPSTLATPSSISALPSTTPPTLSSTLTLPSPPTTSPVVLTSISTSSSTSPSSTTSSVPVSGNFPSHSNHTGVIVGAVLGSVLGSLLLLFSFISFLRKRQRDRQQRNRRTDPPMSEVMWMWHNVDRNDYGQDTDLDAQLRSPGEGTPTSGGDERDAFLRRSGDAPGGSRNGEPTARLVDAPQSSKDSSGRPIGIALTAGAGAAMASGVFEDKSPRLSGASHGGRYVISREQLAESSVSPQGPDFPKYPEEAELEPDAPLLPPPAFNLNVSPGSRKSFLPSERSMAAGNDPESAKRVRVGKNAVPSSSSGTSWLDALGIPNILQRSWLGPKPRSDTPATLSTTTNSSLLAQQLSDNELEAGRSLNAQMRTEMGYRDGARLVSGASGLSTGSGNTGFYDTQLREGMASTPHPVPPLPQGTTSTGRRGRAGPSPLSAEPICAPNDGEGPPAYEPTEPGTSQKGELRNYLDAPVPHPASPFASVSSAKALSPPRGLALPNPHVWRDSAATSSNTSSGVDMDLMEEAPPGAGEGWRRLA